jgi:hypothetical protein
VSVHDRPTAGELIEAVREYLQGEVVPAIADRRARFRALIAVNVLTIVERELACARDDEEAEALRLDALGVAAGDSAARRRAFCAALRRGDFDEPADRRRALAYAIANVAAKLRVANPRYLARATSSRLS